MRYPSEYERFEFQDAMHGLLTRGGPHWSNRLRSVLALGQLKASQEWREKEARRAIEARWDEYKGRVAEAIAKGGWQ